MDSTTSQGMSEDEIVSKSLSMVSLFLTAVLQNLDQRDASDVRRMAGVMVAVAGILVTAVKAELDGIQGSNVDAAVEGLLGKLRPQEVN